MTEPETTPTARVGYLPPERAAWLRQRLSVIADQAFRDEITSFAEELFAEGNDAGYQRGYQDGASDTLIRTVASVMAEQAAAAKWQETPASLALESDWTPGGGQHRYYPPELEPRTQEGDR